MKKNINIHDISRITGYSVSTVSKALNGTYKDVSEKAKRIICETAKSYNYVPNQLASAMVRQRSNNIGVIIPNILNPFFAEVVRGIEDYAYQKGINTIICNSDNDSEKENRYLISMSKGMIDGAIITPSEKREEGYDNITPSNFPIVILGEASFNNNKYPYVKSENVNSAYYTVNCLIEKGHRDILFIGGSESSMISQMRLEGYKKALSKGNVLFDDEKVYCNIRRISWGNEAIENALEKKINFSAVFCTCDSIAYGAISALTKHNLKIPEDVSIIGFDDLDVFSDILELSSMHIPKYKMGKDSSKMLINLINNISVENIVLKPKLILRSSVIKYESSSVICKGNNK